MGVRGTYTIRRDLAIRVIQSRLHELDNESLSTILDEIKPESKLRNYNVEDSINYDCDCNVIESYDEF